MLHLLFRLIVQYFNLVFRRENIKLNINYVGSLQDKGAEAMMAAPT